jgi:hypothetical protein
LHQVFVINKMAVRSIVSVIIALIVLMNNVDAQKPRIKLTVGTMSACRDTVNFFRDHLVATFEEYEEFLDVEFVPWGRTAVQPDGSLVCRFGVDDCWANRMQRCVLNMLKGNNRKTMDFMTCEFQSRLPGYTFRSYECSESVGLNVVDVDHCVNNPQNDNLDEEARIASIEPMAVINFIPFILFDDVVDRDTSNQARQRLSSLVCLRLAEDPNSGITGCPL